MTLFDTILSALGLKSSDSNQQRTTDVTVEHDPDAENEAEVKGADLADDTASESAAAGTDATSSTGSMTEEPPGDDEAAEPAEATDVTEHAGTDHEAPEPAEAAGPVGDEPDPEGTEPAPVDGSPEANTHAASEAEAADEDAESADDGPAADSVDSVDGIGPAYAERLADAGVETVGDLADADPAALAEATDISEKRLTRLVERAQEQLD